MSKRDLLKANNGIIVRVNGGEDYVFGIIGSDGIIRYEDGGWSFLSDLDNEDLRANEGFEIVEIYNRVFGFSSMRDGCANKVYERGNFIIV